MRRADDPTIRKWIPIGLSACEGLLLRCRTKETDGGRKGVIYNEPDLRKRAIKCVTALLDHNHGQSVGTSAHRRHDRH